MIKGKLVLKGKIVLISPASIGCGKNESSDAELLRDKDQKPYVPATSFAGVLRHNIKPDSVKKEDLDNFWGNENNLRQSSVIFGDLLPCDENVKTKIRDGVKINNSKGIAEDKAKFDYELLEKGTEFSLYIEITLTDNSKDNILKKQLLATIIEVLKEEKIRIGAKTNSGLGKIKLSDYNVYEFDFSRKEDVLKWLKQDFSTPTKFDEKPIELKEKEFVIDGYFTIRNSLIVRSYNYDPESPDIENIKSNDKPVLPGTSTKGAIRSRAEKIVLTLGKSEKIIKELFGYVDENKKEAKKGRINVEESILEGFPEEVQTRIKIDRFTGGVMEGALVETKPIFRGKNESLLNIKITIKDYKDYEAGLLLLVLKDLWTGDLPIGGEKAIGRGVLEGKKMRINWDGNEILFEDISHLKEEEKNKLENFVKTFVNYGG